MYLDAPSPDGAMGISTGPDRALISFDVLPHHQNGTSQLNCDLEEQTRLLWSPYGRHMKIIGHIKWWLVIIKGSI